MGGFLLLQIVILGLILRCASTEGRSEGGGCPRQSPVWGGAGVGAGAGAESSADADDILRHLRVTIHVENSGLREAPGATQSYGSIELVNKVSHEKNAILGLQEHLNRQIHSKPFLFRFGITFICMPCTSVPVLTYEHASFSSLSSASESYPYVTLY